MIHCPVCKKELPLDFFECPECGTRNPQLQMIQRTVLTIQIDNAVMRTLERLVIKHGKPIDDLVCQAVEFWLRELNARKVSVF